MRKIKYVCEDCGSEAVDIQGSGWWNVILQRIEWSWDCTYCPSCGDEVGTIAQYLPPEVPENVKVI